MDKNASHTHLTEDGSWVKCYHKSKALVLSWEFWFATTICFPIEHALWELTPLKHITQWLGL